MAEGWQEEPVAQLRRWWSRRYARPPNDPLFAAESTTYWHAHLLLDSHAEAVELTEQLKQVPPGGHNKAYATWRRQAVGRLEALYATLGMRAQDAAQLVAEDQAAAQRGELPAWMRKKMAAPTPDTGPADG